MVFPIVFAPQSDLTSLLHFRVDDPATPGRLLSIRPTDSSYNRKTIFDYYYRYDVDGKAYEGHSYAPFGQSDEGRNVLIRYVPGRPALSRLDGMRAAPFPVWTALLAALFPALGLVFLRLANKRFVRNLHLVRHGVLTTARLGRREPTTTTINDRRVYRIYFRFKTPDGCEHESFVETSVTDHIEDQRDEALVYEPGRPSMAVLLDTLPAEVKRLIVPD